MKLYRFGIVFLACLSITALGLSPKVKSHERWALKTSYAELQTAPTPIGIDYLSELPVPTGVTLGRYNRNLIPGKFGGFREGEFVRTTGWLHLAAFSTDDSDYHLQITGTSKSGDNCVIVEIPDPRNAARILVLDHWKADRIFIDSLCGGRRPSAGGTVLRHPVRVVITGQLFYDISHRDPQSRGKKKMKAATSWEIHPVWTIGPGTAR